jgi:hypothetical protein
VLHQEALPTKLILADGVLDTAKVQVVVGPNGFPAPDGRVSLENMVTAIDG